jgi:hypothetical protein
MHRHRFSSSSLVLVIACFTGCGANLAPVLDVQNAPVITPQGVPPTRPLVRDSIVRALASRNWQIAEERPDELVARVSAGGHDATVLVRYDERYFSISRVDSSPGLKYDGSYIHRRYNHWIDRLRTSIQQELSHAVPAAQPAQTAAAPGEPAPEAADVGPSPALTAPAEQSALPPAPPPAKP